MASIFISTNERTNFARMCWIVVDVFRDILWRVLADEISPAVLPSKVRTNQHKLGNLNKDIKSWLCSSCPASPIIPTSKDFDVTSLYTLIRSLCNQVPVPTNGWGQAPPPSGGNLGDEIERVRVFRNSVYGHAKEGFVKTINFNDLCREMKTFVTSLDAFLGGNCDFMGRINSILACSMDRALQDTYIDKMQEIAKLSDEVSTVKQLVGRIEKDLRDTVMNVSATTSKRRKIESSLKGGLETLEGRVENLEKGTPDESQTEDDTTASPHTSTPMKQYVRSSFMMPDLQTLMKHEANMTPSQVPTAVITSEIDNNGSASTVSLMNTSTMQPPTFINTRMANNDTSSSPTETMTTTGCTIIPKPPAHETQTSAITTTSSVNYNTTTGLPVRFDMTRSIICRQESELGRGCYETIVDSFRSMMSTELLTETPSGRTSSSPHTGPEQVKESVVIPTFNMADYQNGKPFSGTASVALPSSTKKRKRIKADESRKRLKPESQEIKMISETADELADLMKSGKISKVAETLMTEMQKKVKSVWVGFRQMYPNVPIFVLISDNNGVKLSEKDIPCSFRSFEFVFRHEFEVSEEAREITKNEIRKKEMGNRNQRGLKNTLSQNIDQLLRCHSNIEMVGVSTVRSVQYGHRNARSIPGYCIVIYVHVKGIIPYGEKEFPSHIEDFPVDVREGKFVPYSNVPGAREYHHRMLMGCQIVRCDGSSGTLGGFLDLEGGGIGILTCAHVALTEDERNTYLDSKPDEQLLLQTSIPWKTPRMGQPDEYHAFGTVLKFALQPGGPSEVGIDAAVVTITEHARKPVSGAFPKNPNSASGFAEDNPMEFPSGHCITIEDEIERCEVVKFGATTDITRGLIAHNCLYARRSCVKDLAFKDCMYNQMEITPLKEFCGFAQKGDSGAIVFMAYRGNMNELAAVGMVVGGTTSDTTVVTPILDILKALGIKNLSFKTFDAFPRPRQLLSLEDLKKGQEEQSKQIDEIKKDIAKTHTMIESLSEQIQARR